MLWRETLVRKSLCFWIKLRRSPGWTVGERAVKRLTIPLKDIFPRARRTSGKRPLNMSSSRHLRIPYAPLGFIPILALHIAVAVYRFASSRYWLLVPLCARRFPLYCSGSFLRTLTLTRIGSSLTKNPVFPTVLTLGSETYQRTLRFRRLITTSRLDYRMTFPLPLAGT